jgi:hypothetical protein
MSATQVFRRTSLSLGAIGLGLAVSVSAFAGPKPACSTNGSVQVTAISPAAYTYTLGVAGSQAFSFTVSSPGLQINPSCDNNLPYVFGNGNGVDPAALPLTLSIGAIVENGIAVSASTDAALRSALSAFATAPFQLASPGTGSQSITFSFTNSGSVPVGIYDLTVNVQPETGTGVGAAGRTFTIQVDEPQAVDTQAPTVNIVAPVSGSLVKLYDSLQVNFTSVDPPEGGAGTGVQAARAKVTSCNGGFSYDFTSSLNSDPALPVEADTTVTTTTSITPWLYVGSFTLTAEADDNAGHTGSATATFTAGTNIAPLPPISVLNRQFNVASTLPIKFTITDGAGSLLPPMDGLVVKITTPSGAVEERVAGSGAANVRWDLDEYGSATQYITNYPIQVAGTYRVDIMVSDVCAAPALQGGFTFVAASKGGKQ